MPTVEERLASLEAKVDTMSDLRNLIVELRADMNGRLTELRGDVKRLDQKVDRQFLWLVGTQLALLLAAVGALLGAYYR